MIKRYAVDGSWVFCTSGIVWQKMKVSSQLTIRKQGCLAATLNDRVGINMGGCPQMLLAGALIAAIMAAFLVMAAAVFVMAGIVLINFSVCGLLTRTGIWNLLHKHVKYQKQNALMVEAQIPCLLGGMNTIIHVGDMIMYAKFSQFSYYRKDDEDIDHQNEYKELIEEGIGLQEVNPKKLPSTVQKLLNNNKTGFHAKIFQDDLGRYVVAFRGTVTDDADLTMKDIKANAEQALHLESEQYNKAMKLSNAIDEEFSKEEIIFVGHSKGGGEAAAGGTITGKPTYTYNSAGLSEETVSRYGKDNEESYSLKDSKHIIALNATTDILSMAQDGKFFIAGALSQIPIIGPLLAVPVAQMPQAAGKRTSLMTDKTFNPLANHGLEPLIRALQKKAEDPAINVIAKDFEKL